MRERVTVSNDCRATHCIESYAMNMCIHAKNITYRSGGRDAAHPCSQVGGQGVEGRSMGHIVDCVIGVVVDN